MPKTPPGPGETLHNKVVTPKTDATAIVDLNFNVGGDGSKNYVTAPFSGEVPKVVPFLIGRDGKLYIRKDIVPAGTKGFHVTITPVS